MMFAVIVARLKHYQLPRGETDQRASRADMKRRRGQDHNRKGDLFSLGTSILYSAAQTQSHPASTHHKPAHLALLKQPYECPSSKTILQHHSRQKHIRSTIHFFLICHVQCSSETQSMKWECIYNYMSEEDSAKMAKKLKTYCCHSSNVWAFLFLAT